MSLPPLKQVITADTSQLEAGLERAQGGLKRFAAIGAAAVVAAGTALAAMTVRAMQNIDAMTKQARSLGLTTRAFQAMSLVAKEAGVSSGQLASSLGLMQRQIIELERGTSSATEAFGSLGLTLRDLQGLSPDEQFEKIANALNKIEDPARRTATAMQVFGRSGRDVINMLEGYSDKIADATEFQERFGIAVSQTDAEAIERANDAVGRLREIFSGLGNILAARVAPVIARVAEVLISMSGMLARRLNPAMSEYDKATRDASDAQKALNEAMGIFHKTAAPESAKRALGLAQAYLLQAQNAVNAAKAERELAAAEQERRLAQAPGYLQRAFEEGNLQIPELEAATARLEEASKRLSDAQVQLQRRVREITASENMVYIGGPTEDEPPAVPSIGGGSSVRDMMAERLEALREGLMTENEVVSTWYVDSLQTLNDALAARQLTEEEYMELRERLEKEHQSRLNAIRAAGEHTGLETTKSVLGSMLQAVQAGGDKLINAQKAVSAAIAAINVYEGITKALTLEWPQNFIVAAQVAAQGFAAVSRIQSMGRGGSTAAVTGGAATSAPALPRQNIVIDLVGDTFSRMSVQEVFNQINQGLRQGYQIEGILAR